MTFSTRSRFVAAACAVSLGAVTLGACADTKNEVQDAGATMTSVAVTAGEKATDAAKDGADKAGDAAKDAKDDAKDGADKAGDAMKDGAKDAKDGAEGAAATATDAMKDAKDDAKDAMKDGDVEMITMADLDGKEVGMPAAIGDVYREIGGPEGPAGKFVNASNENGKWVANFSNGWHIAFTEETGAQPVKGRIGEFWYENGGITNPVGMPKAPEMEAANGWTQDFTDGVIWADQTGAAGIK